MTQADIISSEELATIQALNGASKRIKTLLRTAPKISLDKPIPVSQQVDADIAFVEGFDKFNGRFVA